MAALAKMKWARSIATNAFLNPWHNETRAKIMRIGFLANLGYGTLSFTLNYAMAGVDLMNSLIYQVLRMALMGFLAVPVTFWFLSRYKKPFVLMLIQFASLGLYFIDPSSGLINAFAITLTFAPFLALHNYRFAKNRSQENSGNETALNSFMITMSYSSGLFMGGLFLQHDLYYTAVVGGSLCTIFGAYFLYYPITGKDNIHKVWGLVGRDKPSSRISFFYGLFNPMIDGCLPIWMRILGISPLGAGINMSLRPMVGFLLTPLVGWMIQKRGFQAAQIGGVGIIVGWTLMAGAAQYPWLLAFGLGILSIGSNLLLPMEVSRWYKRRSSAGTIAREALVVSGRIPSYFVGIITCFLAPAAFPILGLTLSGLFIFGTRPKRKGLGWKRKP